MQNQPYIQHPAGSPRFHPATQNNGLQPDYNQRPRDDYFYASHYTWHHDSDQTDDDTNPALYQAHQAQGTDPAALSQAQDNDPAMQLHHPWEPHTHELSPAMYHPGDPHTHDIDPAMFHPWGLHTHDVSPAMFHPGDPHTHDVSPAMFHPWDPHHDHHPEGWEHYSIDYHYDWYHHWDDQRSHGFYPPGYHPWPDYHW